MHPVKRLLVAPESASAADAGDDGRRALLTRTALSLEAVLGNEPTNSIELL